MLLEKMRSVIKYAIDLDIDYLETFVGYEGDKVLKITTKSQHVIDLIEAYLKKINLEYKSEFDISGQHGSSYNLYVGVEDPSIFRLKKS